MSTVAEPIPHKAKRKRYNPAAFVGLSFGKWTVISVADPIIEGSARRRSSAVQCECACGTKRAVTCRRLVTNCSQSCGCLRYEAAKAAVTKHGGSVAFIAGSLAAGSYLSMRNRCLNPKSEMYRLYGGRGIKICDRWLGDGGFARFLEDMGEPLSRAYTVDRKDTNGPYSPDNCRWATNMQQHANKRTNVFGWLNGERLHIAEIARREGVTRGTAGKRIKRGMYQP